METKKNRKGVINSTKKFWYNINHRDKNGNLIPIKLTKNTLIPKHLVGLG